MRRTDFFRDEMHIAILVEVGEGISSIEGEGHGVTCILRTYPAIQIVATAIRCSLFSLDEVLIRKNGVHL
jgi:hypothetical protein